MNWKGRGQTHIGKVRQMNQDAFGLYDDLSLWIIADGMGGHAGGEIASQLAVEKMASYIRTRTATFLNNQHDSGWWKALLGEAMEQANQAIRDHAREHIEYTGMGTTAVAVHISGPSPALATIAHAGDSRAYLLRDQSLSQLTRDHSLIEERIEMGIITPDQAWTHPLRHVLTRALGIEPSVMPSVNSFELKENDQILLCTDGLTKMMMDQHILDTILNTNTNLDGICQALIEEANKEGGQDNVTVVMLGVTG